MFDISLEQKTYFLTYINFHDFIKIQLQILMESSMHGINPSSSKYLWKLTFENWKKPLEISTKCTSRNVATKMYKQTLLTIIT